MTSPHSLNHEQLLELSALADGHVTGHIFANTLSAVAQSPQLPQSWHLYHLIGDVMRSDALAPTAYELNFLERLNERLVAESDSSAISNILNTAPEKVAQISANDETVRWKWLAGMLFTALVVLVAASGWVVQEDSFSRLTSTEILSTVTAVTSPIAVNDDRAVMMRSPEFDALMAAHQQLGGHSAFQVPSGFLRNAIFNRPPP